MSASTTPRIAITMGDPSGIGPEIILKAVEALRPQLADGEIKLFVVGSRGCMLRAAEIVACGADWIKGDVPGVQLVNIGEPEGEIAFGRTTAEAGRLAYLAIEKAVSLCLAGEADAIVTAPISKEALNLAGQPFSGHTELLAHLTGARDSVMLLAHGDMRVSHVSTHVSLADAVRRLTPERLTRVAELTHEALRDLGIENPRIAVAALNPHAGEGGLFGTEDLDVTEPTVAALNARGLNVEGPVPGDTVFVKLRGRRYDAVIATYHDQGHIPVKLLGFEVNPETGAWEALSGVNITLGLPIVRSSVDHGTAFDIAGKGIASERSMLEAIDYAVQLAAARKARGA
ncbi:4-hydroxythreonine-4-phosphate dehydrogenase PdxA [Actibacterium sp. MT2.3-13A]|uniref:4-hydroxythreonine-4-phosphate dehydrogenase PdxA n=1 Tax=Actibacterium sp. MT2.3-13A TaxID=2828332 RepID=UPI001BAB5EF6|nr:4-hydroxythreonine-4-phosphate dehydrogenase PdxA [Actibacterium sp. MT2.3-13A]